MEIINQYHQIAAVLIARIFLGCLFFFQGYEAVFKIGIKNAIDAYSASFENKSIPKVLIICASWFTAYSELIGGLLLIVGLFNFAALYVLGINILIAAIGFGLNNPLWDLKHVLPRLILVLFLLSVPSNWHFLSFDNLINL